MQAKHAAFIFASRGKRIAALAGHAREGTRVFKDAREIAVPKASRTPYARTAIHRDNYVLAMTLSCGRASAPDARRSDQSTPGTAYWVFK
jgi:hypothetical protein